MWTKQNKKLYGNMLPPTEIIWNTKLIKTPTISTETTTQSHHQNIPFRKRYTEIWCVLYYCNIVKLRWLLKGSISKNTLIANKECNHSSQNLEILSCYKQVRDVSSSFLFSKAS